MTEMRDAVNKSGGKLQTKHCAVAAGSGTAISAEVCTVFALSLQRVGGNLAMQWFGHTGRVLSLPFCHVCVTAMQDTNYVLLIIR